MSSEHEPTGEKYAVHEIDVTAKTLEREDNETKKEFEALNLEKLHINVYSETNLSPAEVKEKLDNPDTNIYVLIHGWTATHEIFDSVHKPPLDETIVEQIRRNDANAVIICVDGNGFGESKYKDGLSNDKLKESTTTEAYARQIDFALKRVLLIDESQKDRIYAMGHSHGGATVQELVAEGKLNAENCVAVCPAFLSDKENSTKEKNQAEKVRDTYRILGAVISVAGHCKRINNESINSKYVDKLVEAAVDLATKGFLFDHLAGGKNAGTNSPVIFDSIMAELLQIHGEQIVTKHDVAAAEMYALSEGTSVTRENFDMAKASKVDCVCGGEDILAPQKADFGVVKSIPGAGHYAPLFESGENDPTSLLLRKMYTKRGYYLNIDQRVPQNVYE